MTWNTLLYFICSELFRMSLFWVIWSQIDMTTQKYKNMNRSIHTHTQTSWYYDHSCNPWSQVKTMYHKCGIVFGAICGTKSAGGKIILNIGNLEYNIAFLKKPWTIFFKKEIGDQGQEPKINLKYLKTRLLQSFLVINQNKLGLSWAKLSCQLGFGFTVNFAL